MAKTAFLFPGQGSQEVGMGQDLHASYPEARARFEAANELLGFSLTDEMFGDAADQESLTRTQVAQPALYTHSLAVMAILDEHGLQPDMTAGHSLGEYSALAAAGALSFEEGLQAVRRRGELMAEAGDRRSGTMAAVLGMEDDALEEVCRDASTEDEVVQSANYNAPGQIVISGDVAAVDRAAELAEERGARRAIKLTVSGAFHSPLMEYAREGLAETLNQLTIREPRCPVYLNVTARPTTDPDEIRSRLLEQLLSPVRWAQSVRRMHEDGAERFVEVGAGHVLSGLTRRILGRSTDTAAVGTADELQPVLGQ